MAELIGMARRIVRKRRTVFDVRVPWLSLSSLVALLALAPFLAMLDADERAYRSWRLAEERELRALAAAEPVSRAEVLETGAVLLTESAMGSDFGVTTDKSARRAKARVAKEADPLAGAERSGLFGTPPAKPKLAAPVVPRAPKVTAAGPAEYRTVCVRLCDGFYWPISFATTRSGLQEDKIACESSCGSPVRMFFYTVRDETPEVMKDLKGRPYSELPAAFRYRTAYDAACKCTPHPWEEASLARHRRYAEEAMAGKVAKVDERRAKRKPKVVGLASFEPSDTDASGIGSRKRATKVKTLVPRKGKGKSKTVDEGEDAGLVPLSGTLDGAKPFVGGKKPKLVLPKPMRLTGEAKRSKPKRAAERRSYYTENAMGSVSRR